MEVPLAIKLVYRHSTVNVKVKVTIQTLLRTPTGGRQPVGYLQSVVELNQGQPETNPSQRLDSLLDMQTWRPSHWTTLPVTYELTSHEKWKKIQCGKIFAWTSLKESGE